MFKTKRVDETMGLEHCDFGDLNLFRISIFGFRICSPFVLLNSTLFCPGIHGLARKFTSMLADIGDEIFYTGQVDVQFVSVASYNEGIVGIAVVEG
jgi:hypothetical protein